MIVMVIYLRVYWVGALNSQGWEFKRKTGTGNRGLGLRAAIPHERHMCIYIYTYLERYKKCVFIYEL